MKHSRIKNLLKKYFVICSIIVFILIYTITAFKSLVSFDPLVMFTFFCIGGLSFINLISSLQYEFSLYKIHGYFFLIFFFLAPIHQYVTRTFPWGWSINPTIIILGNLLIILWLIIYMATYYLIPSAKKTGQLLPRSMEVIIIGFVLTIISALLTIYSVGGISNLLLRDGTNSPILQSISLILGTAVRPFPVLFFSYLFIVFRKKNSVSNIKGLSVLMTIVFLIVLMTNFPTAVSRYHAAAVYLGLILLIFHKRISFDILFLIGILIVFPTLELFRRSSVAEVFTNFQLQTIELSTGHFDAYSMFMRTIEVVIMQGPSYGYQLLGAIFFFIPRSVWPTKPVGSGTFVGEALGLKFLNISSPLIAEVLINFGFVFFIFGPFLIGILSKKMDTQYWGFNNSFRYISIYYIFFIGFFFFILRGDLLSSFAYTIGFFIPMILFYFIKKIKLNYSGS